MILPNYRDGSIVNLMSSILHSFGKSSEYKPLKNLPLDKLEGFQNTVLLIIDGLGYNYLKSKSSFLKDRITASLTSVVPSTTASAITTFATGVAPQQHAITGWYTNIKELGGVTTVLPFTNRLYGEKFENIPTESIFDQKMFPEKTGVKNYFINYHPIAYSKVARVFTKNAETIPYRNFGGMLTALKNGIKKNNRRKYLYLYYPLYDTYSHKYGVGSREVHKHFNHIDKCIQKIEPFLRKNSTRLLISADHGFMDTRKELIINIDEHPLMNDALSLPLCGEPRLAFCYVRKEKSKIFEDYVKTKMRYCCDIYKSSSLVKKGYFGLGAPHPKLSERVGDYTLVMKDDYIIKDYLLGEKRTFKIGNHGGLSRREMLVPLCII